MKLLILSLFSFGFILSLNAQETSIREEKMILPTYMFSEPDPVPEMGPIYPYFRFDGYTDKADEKTWNMVILENEFIKVFVCPDIGGKVWGAIEKSTGNEFLYFNHVVKFRDVAMRGAWTSGGLEFNFGDIGHIPTCATPVDYLTRQNDDGSVSCIVGAIDLPSQTRWNIEIKLAPGQAYFKTIVSWFNSTHLPCTYYHWMNAAAKASGNLEFIYPGINYIGHGGEPGQWPVEKDRKLFLYEENDFGPYKSYHVLNVYSDFFGGYWHDDNFGFGHYTSYDDKPGKKLWIWGLSDQGMIWEDLLTDTDGQYIEYQAGKLFNQAASNSTLTPFKHKEFSPYDSDIMSEIWFPIKGTKGMVAASEYAILNIEREKDSSRIYLSALQTIKDTLFIEINNNAIKQAIDLKPLQLFEYRFKNEEGNKLNLILGDHLLSYSSDQDKSLPNRPILPNPDMDWKSAYGLFTQAQEQEKQRMYPQALETYQQCLKKDPAFLPALSRLSLAYYRRMEYNTALEFSQRALSIDTYDPDANYAFGLVNKSMGNMEEAKSGFSIASQAISKRSAAYVELSKIFLSESNYSKAVHYATRALEYNKNSIVASEILAYSYRKQKKASEAKLALRQVYALDALSDFARFEELKAKGISLEEFKAKITNELSVESYLSLALTYYQYNDFNACLEVLKMSPKNPIVQLWIVYLQDDKGNDSLIQALELPAQMVFPYRNETGLMLESLIQENERWELKYYLGLIHWKNGLTEKAKELFLHCGNNPDFAAFYLAKAKLFEKDTSIVKNSLLEAMDSAPDDWRTALALSNYYLENNATNSAIKLSGKFTKLYPEIPSIGMTYAKALMKDNRDEACLSFLESWNILPYEGAIDGKKLYTRACVKLAMEAYKNKKEKKAISYSEKAKAWPRNLGVGKPYDVDERLENYIMALAHEQEGDDTHFSIVAKHVPSEYLGENSGILLQALALKKINKADEGIELLENAQTKNPDNIYVKWAYEKYINSTNAEKLEAEIINGDYRDKTAEDENFDLVVELLKTPIK